MRYQIDFRLTNMMRPKHLVILTVLLYQATSPSTAKSRHHRRNKHILQINTSDIFEYDDDDPPKLGIDGSTHNDWIGGSDNRRRWKQRKIPHRTAKLPEILLIAQNDGPPKIRKKFANHRECIEEVFSRKRSKRQTVNSDSNIQDILVENSGYRIYYVPHKWSRAKDQCDHYKKDYGAKLAEMRTHDAMKHLVYAITQNRKGRPNVEHIWLGGIYENKQWRWISDNEEVAVEEIEGWISGVSYNERSASTFTCLNLDVSFDNTTQVYGTHCLYPQIYICEFPSDKLIQLGKDEGRRLATEE